MDEFASGVSPASSPQRVHNLQRTYSDRFVPSRTGSDLTTYALELAHEENVGSAPQVDREVRVLGGAGVQTDTRLRGAFGGCSHALEKQLLAPPAHGVVDLRPVLCVATRGWAGHEQPGVWGRPAERPAQRHQPLRLPRLLLHVAPDAAGEQGPGETQLLGGGVRELARRWSPPSPNGAPTPTSPLPVSPPPAPLLPLLSTQGGHLTRQEPAPLPVGHLRRGAGAGIGVQCQPPRLRQPTRRPWVAAQAEPQDCTLPIQGEAAGDELTPAGWRVVVVGWVPGRVSCHACSF
jgi:hypothetical protein